MPHDQPLSDGQPVNPEVRYEPTDVEVRGVVRFAAGLVVLLALSGVGVWWLCDYLARVQTARKDLPSPWATESRPLPPTPRLEGLNLGKSEHDVGRLYESSAREQVAVEEAHLGRYGWADRKSGRVHVPIEVAMKRLAEKPPARGAKP